MGGKGEPIAERLVNTLEWRYRLALVLVEGVSDDSTVLDVDLWRVDIVLPGEGVLHPLIIVTLPITERILVGQR